MRTSTKTLLSCHLCPLPHALLLDLIQESYSMASTRIGELQADLTAARNKVNLELDKVPIDYAKIGVYERQIDNLIQEIQTYSRTTGELLQ